MSLPMSEIFYQWNKLPCQHCGERDVGDGVWVVTVSMDVGVGVGMPMEQDIRCPACGKSIDYWAYGYRQGPETYTELFRQRLQSLFTHTIPLIFIKHWGFTDRSPEVMFCKRYSEAELASRRRTEFLMKPHNTTNHPSRSVYVFGDYVEDPAGGPQYLPCQSIDALPELKGGKVT